MVRVDIITDLKIRSDDSDANEFNKKQQLCTCRTLFCTFPWRGATAQNNVKTDAYFHVFMEDVNKPPRLFLPLFELGYCRNSILGEFANILHSKWVGIIAMKI